MPETVTNENTEGSTTTENSAATEPAETTTPTFDEQVLKAIQEQNELITETNRVLGVIAEQDRNDAETQTIQNQKLDTINETLNKPPEEGSAPDQLTALQEISADTEVLLERLDSMNSQNYETGWLLALVIIFTIGFKTFVDTSTRW